VFYEQLYDSNIQREESENSNEPIPNVIVWEVKDAVKILARGKAQGQITSSLIQSKMEIM